MRTNNVDSPIEFETTYNSKELLEKLVVISDPDKVNGFKAFHGTYFNSYIDIFDVFFEKVNDEIQSFILLSDDRIKVIINFKEHDIFICFEEADINNELSIITDQTDGITMQRLLSFLNINDTSSKCDYKLWKLYQKYGLNNSIHLKGKSLIDKENNEDEDESI